MRAGKASRAGMAVRIDLESQTRNSSSLPVIAAIGFHLSLPCDYNTSASGRSTVTAAGIVALLLTSP